MTASGSQHPRHTPWQQLEREGVLRPLDAEIGRLLAALDAEADPCVALAAALTSRAVADGHACVPLAELAHRLPAGGVTLPTLPELRASLCTSPLVGRDDDSGRRELYLDAGERLYLGRFFHYEATVAHALTRLATHPAEAIDAVAARRILARHFAPATAAVDWQAVAVATGLCSRLTLITGGPGTGKTTTVQWLLAALLELAQASGQALPKIALAAPTGKAATRLADALRAGRGRLQLSPDLLPALPTDTCTLHRLLGSIPGSARFRHHAGHPLDVDVLVVDEVSMVDLPLMAKLLDALPDHARLVLLGDRNQLASVEAGNVLAGLCEAAGRGAVGAAHAARIRALCGVDLELDPHATPFADGLVELTHSHRFGTDTALGELAAAIRAGDVARTLAALDRGGATGLAAPSAAGVGADLVDRHALAFAALAHAPTPAAALHSANRLRILTALRDGPRGCVEINQAIERALRLRVRCGVNAAFYPGRLLMITENAYDVGLFNGDTGVVLADRDSRLVAWFPAADGPRSLPLAALPAHESAFAITIHKSQGSEFDQVSLVLPGESSPILGRELLYTAVTRARDSVLILADAAALQQAIQRSTRRHSGLAQRLRHASQPA
ncbi:MAG TPA: exodeoxyribonuclease V subunit alpha [Rhodanobacteraceae bacterium]|nr:exodeoxyribonuclease V subunit alpha [Rhodanobacteraceae bacterium]